MRHIKDLELQNKRVIVRVDLNVTISDWKIVDDSRLYAVLETINFLLKQNCKIILISHFGRPKGKFNESMSLRQVVPALSELVGMPIKFVPSVIGIEAKKAVESLKNSEILLLENIRFYSQEEENDEKFAKKISSFGDIFINDTFSCSHRNHASIVSIPKFLPNAAGFLMYREIENLQQFFNSPKKPVAAVTGGAKISTKISLLHNLINQVDKLVIGGAMANNFLKVQGHEIGQSLFEENWLKESEKILKIANNAKCKIILPKDVVVTKSLTKGSENRVLSINNVAKDDIIVDLGPCSIESIFHEISSCKTIMWNGPLGAFEIAPFGTGTIVLARYLGLLTREQSVTTIIGGGDIVAALTKAGLKKSFSHVSTSGGAFLKWLEQKTLPGIEALNDK